VFQRLDFDDFHRNALPELLAERGEFAARGAGVPRPIAFRLPDGRAWTYAVADGRVEVTPGDASAATVVALDEQTWSDFVNEVHTCFGLLYAGKVAFPSGSFEHLDWWESVLRALFDGRPPYDPAAVDTADLHRSFALDDADDAAAFLQRNGFAVLRGVFTEDELASVRNEVARVRAERTPTDGHTWWAKDSSGVDVCCRLIYATDLSPLIASFVADERLDRLGALGGLPLVRTDDRLDGVSVVLKNPAVVEGLSDLPWHRDCGLGGHPVLCPAVLVGIQLDAANERTGQLQFLAGSHRTTGGLPMPGTEDQLPIVGVDAEPGDVTVHFGHVLHVAPPPADRGPARRTMYVTYANPDVLDVIPPGQGYNDVLFTMNEDGHVRSPQELSSTP
jgi:hypothetical protein